MLNYDPNLHTHKFTGGVHSEPLRRAEQHTLHAVVSRDTHLSICRWIIKGTAPPPCFLHGLELVALPEYKDHVALEFEGWICLNFDVFLILCVESFLYLSIPLSYPSCFPLAFCSYPANSYQNYFPPRSLLRHYFHLLAHTLSGKFLLFSFWLN